MALTNKLDAGARPVRQGRGPWGLALSIPQESSFQDTNAGDERTVRGNMFAFVRFGVAVERGDVVMFDERYGEDRIDDNNNFTSDAAVPNGAQKIINTWADGANTVMLGVVAATYAKGDYGWVVRRGRWIAKFRRDTADAAMNSIIGTALGANEGAGLLSKRDSGASYYGFSFNLLTAVAANNTEEAVVMDIVFPHGSLGTTAAAVAQPDTVPSPIGRPTNQ